MGFFKSIKRGFSKIGKTFTGAVKSVGKAVSKGINSVLKAGEDLIKGTVNFVGELFGANTKPDQGSYDTPGMVGQTLNFTGGEANTIPLIYSGVLAKCGSVKTFMDSDGDTNKFLYQTQVLCHGAVEVLNVIDNQKPDVQTIPFFDVSGISDGGALTFNRTSDKTRKTYHINNSRNFGEIAAFDGSFEQGTVKPSWNKDKAEYARLVHIRSRLEWPSDINPQTTEAPFTGVPDFQFKVVRPPSFTLGVNNKTGIQVLYDYLRNPYYGLGLSADSIDATSWEEFETHFLDWGANHTITSLHTLTYKTVRLDTSKPVIENIQALLFALGATMIWKNNKFYLKFNPNVMNQAVTSSYRSTNPNMGYQEHTIAERDIIGGVSWESPAEDQKFKKVILETYDNEDIATLEADITEPNFSKTSLFGQITRLLNSMIGLKQDNQATKEEKITVVGLLNRRLAKTILGESQTGATIQIATTAKHANIEPYDIIDVTYPKANISNAKFVVLECEYTPAEQLLITAQRYLYDDDAAGTTTSDIFLNTTLDEIERQTGSKTKALVSVPVGFGLENNTQVDRFITQNRAPTQVDAINVETKTQYFRSAFDDRGRRITINRARIDWTITGDPNNTRYSVELKKEGELSFDKLFDTDEKFAFVENLDDLAIYYVRITPKNDIGFGRGKTVKFTSLKGTSDAIVSANKEFPVTDENGETGGTGVVLQAGSSPIFDDHIKAFNIFDDATGGAYVAKSNVPLANTYDDDLYKEAMLDSRTAAHLTAWDHYNYTYDSATNTPDRGPLIPVSGETSAQWDARVGTWGGTDHVLYQNSLTTSQRIDKNIYQQLIDDSRQDYDTLAWQSHSITTLAGSSVEGGFQFHAGKEDFGTTGQDFWWEGIVEQSPDEETADFSYATNYGYRPVEQASFWCYMHVSDQDPTTRVADFTWRNDNQDQLNTVGYTGGIADETEFFDTGSGGVSLRLIQGKGVSTSPFRSNTYPTTSEVIHVAKPTQTGRYIRPIFYWHWGDTNSASVFGIRNYKFKVSTELYTHTFRNIDTSTLSGNTSERTFTFTRPRFGRIKDVIITTNSASSTNVIGVLTEDPVDNVQQIKFKCVETQNNNNVNAKVNIQIIGYPEVKHVSTTTPTGDTRYIEYKNNFEGNL